MSAIVCPSCSTPNRTGDDACRHCGYVFPSSGAVLTPGAILHGRYQIEQLLHTGGMGYIYLARDRNLFSRSCVIKQVRERVHSDDHRKQLEEEALRMSGLSHPRIAMIFDHFVEDGFYFIVVERIPGSTLSDVARHRPTLPGEDEVVTWAISMCEVIVYLHKMGVVHRDVSPDNIMLTDDGDIKFIDFGTLRELRYVAAGGTAGMGKFGYAPPEQWQGKPIPQSDIFALGATIYQLLTGYLPLSHAYLVGQTPQRDDYFPRYPLIREQNTAISRQLETILEKALQLDISKRYGNAVDMLRDLAKLREDANAPSPRPLQTTVIPVAGAAAAEPETIETNTGLTAQPITVEVVLSESAIRRRTFSDTLQRPETLLPLAVCAISAGYLVLLSPIIGGALAAIAVTGISGAVAAAFFSSRYPREYARNTEEMIERMSTQRRLLEAAQVKQVHDTLRHGFTGASSTEGVGAVRELISQYDQLQATLAQRRSSDPLSVSILPALAEETYRRGLSVLSDALDLMNAIRTPSKERLLQDIAAARADVDALRDDASQAERLHLRQEVLTSCLERLAMLNKQQISVEQLLYQARRCEAALHAARVDLATIRTGGTRTGVDSVVQALQQRISQVKEVQDELARLGY
jgi:serine/threonine protein kinase